MYQIPFMVKKSIIINYVRLSFKRIYWIFFNVSESLHVFQPIEPIFGTPALKGDTVTSSQDLLVELQDEFEITEGTNITIKSPIVNNKQNQRKKHCCKYCKKLVGNFSTPHQCS